MPATVQQHPAPTWLAGRQCGDGEGLVLFQGGGLKGQPHSVKQAVKLCCILLPLPLPLPASLPGSCGNGLWRHPAAPARPRRLGCRGSTRAGRVWPRRWRVLLMLRSSAGAAVGCPACHSALCLPSFCRVIHLHGTCLRFRWIPPADCCRRCRWCCQQLRRVLVAGRLCRCGGGSNGPADRADRLRLWRLHLAVSRAHVQAIVRQALLHPGDGLNKARHLQLHGLQDLQDSWVRHGARWTQSARRAGLHRHTPLIATPPNKCCLHVCQA